MELGARLDEARYRRSVHGVDVEPAVAVEVEQRHARDHRLGLVLARRAAGVGDEAQPARGGHLLEHDGIERGRRRCRGDRRQGDEQGERHHRTHARDDANVRARGVSRTRVPRNHGLEFRDVAGSAGVRLRHDAAGRRLGRLRPGRDGSRGRPGHRGRGRGSAPAGGRPHRRASALPPGAVRRLAAARLDRADRQPVAERARGAAKGRSVRAGRHGRAAIPCHGTVAGRRVRCCRATARAPGGARAP